MIESWSGLIDAHCHICDEQIRTNLEQEMSDAFEIGATGFISSALSKDEFEWINVSGSHINHQYIRWSAGIHPYYEKSSDKDFDSLVNLCDRNQIIAVGEIGLDGRNHDHSKQKEILLKQLDLAANYNLPVIFHVVHKYYDLLKIIKANFPQIRGYLHGFNNSLEVARQFSGFDLAFSLGCRPPKSQVINFIVKRGFFLFETDAPYQRPKEEKSQLNHLVNLDKVVESTSKNTSISKDELILKQHLSFGQIFSDPELFR